MTENKNDKDKVLNSKSQIELLKQKYLKKNIPVQTSQQAISPRQNYLQQISKPIIQIKQKPKQQQQLLSKSKSAIQLQIINKVNNSPTIKNQPQLKEWSMRDFIQQKKNDNKQQNMLNLKQQNNNKSNVLQMEQKQFGRKTLDINDPFSLKIQFKFDIDSKQLIVNKDPQFQQLETNNSQHNLNIQKIIKNNIQQQKDLLFACKLWLQNSQKALNYIIFPNPTPTFEIIPKPLIINSTNPSFPGIVQQLAQQFIFNNNIILKDSQKQVVYRMALQYFSPSPNNLSDILLICLIKIMPIYASIYVDEIIRKMGYYVIKILQYKKYLLKEQLDCFVKCIEDRLEHLRIQGHKLPLQCFIWILIIRPNSNYCNQILLVRNITNEKELLTIFCALFPQGKQNTLSILYLKCIDALIPIFVKSGILEKVISHLNQIKVPQILYQPVKSLKLKLIKNADTKKQKKKMQQDKGFTNFMNQRISKLKDVLQAKILTKSKSQIYYNSTTGKYQPINSTNNTKNYIV